MCKHHHCLVPETPTPPTPEISPFVFAQYFPNPSLSFIPPAPALSRASSASPEPLSKLVSLPSPQ